MNKRNIVLLPIPFTDLSEMKLRPALVLAKIQEDLLCCFISSQIHTKGGNDVAVRMTPENKLKAHSIIKCGKIFTLHQSLVKQALGILDQKIYDQVTRKIINLIK